MNENIILLFIPDTIISELKNDYPYIKELIEYKKNGTLTFLKAKFAMAFYNGSLGLSTNKEEKNYGEFIELFKIYTRKFVQEGLQNYQNKENEKEKKQFKRLDMGFLGPAIEMISNGINDSYLRKFPLWPSSPGTQENFIEVNMKGSFESNQFRYYWVCKGMINVKDTKYNHPVNGCFHRAELSGNPEFQIACFDLEKITQCNEMAKSSMPKMKQVIDKCEQWFMEQSLNHK